MPSPEVLTGLRQPRTERLAKALSGEVAAPEPAQVPVANADETVYISPTLAYRVQVTAPRGWTDPATGQKMPTAKRIEAIFVDGVYRNGAKGTPGYRNPEVRRLIDDSLQHNPYFGKFGGGPAVHFWLADEQREQTEKARVRGALDVLRSLPPEQVKEFAAMLPQTTETDHKLKPIKTPSPNAADTE